LQIARGVQNKVLEAMAARCPVVVSKGALTGIDAEDGRHLVCAETPAEWIAACVGLAQDRARARRMGDGGARADAAQPRVGEPVRPAG
jgi:glycosyltransferase involved in cell wall biosynthesis